MLIEHHLHFRSNIRVKSDCLKKRDDLYFSRRILTLLTVIIIFKITPKMDNVDESRNASSVRDTLLCNSIPLFLTKDPVEDRFV